MLQDVDLRYKGANLYTARGLEVGGALTVDGSVTSVMPSTTVPADHGLAAWTFDIANASSSFAMTNGTLYLCSVYFRQAVPTVSKLWFAVNAVAVSPVSGQNFVGLYNSSGVLLGSVGIDGKTTTNGAQFGQLGSALTNLTAGQYWVGLMTNSATPPQLSRAAAQVASYLDTNLSPSSYRWAVNGTSLTTALPASITPSANTQTGMIGYWAAAS